MKPYFAFLGVCTFLAICLVYVKTYGWEEFTRWVMNQALGYAAIFAAGGFIADLIKEAKS